MRRPRTLPVLVLLAAALLAPARAHAAGLWFVNSTTDAPDVSPGNGSCATASGTCTLRAAIQEAESDAAADVIFVGPGEFHLSLGTLQITTTMYVAGDGPELTVVDADGTSTVFTVTLNGTEEVLLGGMTIREGSETTGNGGGVSRSGDATTGLYLFDDWFLQNHHDAFGGGVYSAAGRLDVIGSRFEGNSANFNGSALFVNDGTLTIDSSTLKGNTISPGGGSPGGALSTSAASTTITNSLFEGNAHPQGGGGIWSDGTLTITNTTFQGNSASIGTGGAIRTDAATTITNATFADNTAPSGGAIQANGAVTLRNNVFAGAGSCDTGTGSFTSQGGNVEGADTCNLTAGSDRKNTDPMLVALADNGGPTLTRALPLGSPAIGIGSSCPATDQRGAPRPAVCDAGAYQRVLCSGVLVNRVGTPGPDQIVGTTGADGILGLGDDDRISGGDGNDAICGGSGRDRLIGGAGDDTMLGERGADTLRGGLGGDRLRGGAGKDNLIGGTGRDRLNGGGGSRDRCRGGPGADVQTSCER